jgi:uncharacterized protein YdeI (YjbR/CyaY-like superfamily)
MTGEARNFEQVEVKSRAEWRAWLVAHHGQAESIWLVTHKKAEGDKHVPYEVVVEEALCFGWVDSLPRKLDERRSMLLLSPRKPGSAWSRINKERAERMIAAGLMTPAGLARVEQAKADGSWSRLDEVEALAVPGDLAEALAACPNASRNFEAFPRSVKRGILEWIMQAKRPETRAKRVAETARLAAENKRANQFR